VSTNQVIAADPDGWIVSSRGGVVGSTALVRALNERSLLDLLRSDGPSSRVDLARVTGLSKPTVSSALANLVSYGLVVEAGAESGKPGPAAVIYRANAAAGTVMSIDIGRRWVRLAIADLAGATLVRHDIPNKAKNASSLKALVSTLIEGAYGDDAMHAYPKPEVAVVGGPGIPDGTTSSMRVAGAIPGWGKTGFLGELRDVIGSEVIFENDINLAVIGEHTRGAGQGLTDFVLVSIGTGIGCGIMINGALHRGANGAAGELGFLPLGGEGADHIPGQKISKRVDTVGSLERLAAADGIVNAAHAQGLVSVANAKDVFDLAAVGNRAALQVVESTAELLGRALTSLIVLLDPQTILVTGGVGENLDRLLPGLQRTICSYSPIVPTVQKGLLGPEASLHGGITRALVPARETIFNRLAITAGTG
jgi:predicted NBD/HSP70 family sugar kinase